MKKTLTFFTLSMLLFALNCATPGFGPNGGLFTSAKIGTYGTGKPASKTGEACASSILGLVAIGDASVEAAKSQGGINDVSYVDYQTFSILGLYAKLCTVVRGN
ncbi:MAG: TRL-like family protein [Leptospiraceae bacterium]|nr:TRL-like family protein [Leptospiraceae bacterium]